MNTDEDIDRFHREIDALDEASLRRRRTMKWSAIPADVLPAWVAEMDYPLAPVLLEAARGVLAGHDLGYVQPGDIHEAFAGWATRHQSWSPDPGNMAVVGDVMAGLEAGLRGMSDPGDRVAVLTPAYPPFFALLDAMDRRVASVPLLDAEHRWTVDLDTLDRTLAGGARVLLLCHPHNPTGRVFDPVELAAVAEIVVARGARVISDEVHAPLLAGGEGFVPYAASNPAAATHTVTLTSISKGWNVPGLKCALLVGQPETAPVVAAVPEWERLRASVPGVAASAAVWTDDGGWLDATRSYLDRTRTELAAWVGERDWVRAHPARAGYLAWLDLCGSGLGPDPAATLLDRVRVALSPGHRYARPATQGEGRARLNHATSLPLLRRILDRIDAAADPR